MRILVGRHSALAITALSWVLISASAGAASLDLTPGDPDIASGGTISYSHDGSSGLFELDDSGVFTVTYNDGVDLDFLNAVYDLDANFDGSGNFVDGTLSITGASLTANPLWAGPNLVTADLIGFGFQGDGSAGVFEFLLGNGTGDLFQFNTGDGGGVIISTTDLVGAGISGIWDPGNDGEPGFFLNDFSGTAFAVDTFVPVPAAVWLFGSGLLGLFGIARRKPRAAAAL